MKNYPFIKFAILFIIGIVTGSLLSVSNILVFTLTISSIILYITSKKIFNSKILQIILFAVFSISLGLFIQSIQKEEINSKLSSYRKEKNVSVVGTIKEIELKRDYEISFILQTDSVSIENRVIKTNENLLCRLRSDSIDRKIFYDNAKPGNKILVKGTFQQGRDVRNPGEFDYRKFLLSKGITGLITSYDSASISFLSYEYDFFNNLIFQTRINIDELIHQLHNSQTAGLLRGLLLADRTEIDYETKQNFVNSGVIHILAVSGLHVGYILLFFVVLFGRFNIYTRSFLTILGLISFMIITGIPASVFRATLMSVILIIAFLSGRSTNLLNSTALSAVIILIFKPNEIFNPGFQLSYSAVLSIAIIYPVIQKIILELSITNKYLKNILLFAGVSLSAQIGTLPFTLAYFNKLSVISLLSNLVVIPLAGIIVGLAIITLMIGSFIPSFAIYFAIVNNVITSLMMDLIRFTGSLDFAFIRINNFSLLDSIIFYLFIAILIYLFRISESIKIKLAVTLITFANIFVFTQFDDKKLLPDGVLSVMMIDVGQGDSFLIKFPNNKTAIIDAGVVDPYFDTGERIIIPLLDYLGIEQIDYGFVSHLDTDHYGGFASLLYNKRVNEIYRPKPDSSDKSIRFEKVLDKLKIPKYIYEKNKKEIGNVSLYILNDFNEEDFNSLSSNDRSGILKIVFGKTSFLFVGDAEIPAEKIYLHSNRKFLDSDVLKVGHHGSKTGSSIEFLEAVSPEISLVSAGIKNKFGHPSEIVLQRLKEIKSEILRTDSLGAVLLQSDGNKIKVVDWRNF
ncbi:DNA internalization-related competence protein ComEC/Rec2 [Ignavibacterium sp.]|uniref:DNA internalization-related competence protein ComEC/Rec2 n=1 Tax=Ignavibacterium sp. TaxID=2651167 RepID=UPI0021FEC81D|nr:DNA internalization-related competence protein ComEC/Rec2 [Ignavibacterium sp.]BDQ02072.1 MAG: DNA internalization-related competence protein ComEC/Rec2 [Ignavibacterium sp.]